LINIETIKSKLTKTPEIMNKAYFYNSAVLIPIVRLKQEDFLLFEIRSQNIRQGGEVCFPGGRVDGDETNSETALRETMEELGVEREKINYLGALGTFVNVTGFSVDAYVGIIKIKSIEELNINKDEVESVFLVPLEYFINTPPEKYSMNVEISPFSIKDGNKIVTFPADKLNLPEKYSLKRSGISYPVYAYRTEYETIWGITAFLIKYFIDKLKS